MHDIMNSAGPFPQVGSIAHKSPDAPQMSGGSYAQAMGRAEAPRTSGRDDLVNLADLASRNARSFHNEGNGWDAIVSSLGILHGMLPTIMTEKQGEALRHISQLLKQSRP